MEMGRFGDLERFKSDERVRVKSAGKAGVVIGSDSAQSTYIYMVLLDDGRHAFFTEETLEAEEPGNSIRFVMA